MRFWKKKGCPIDEYLSGLTPEETAILPKVQIIDSGHGYYEATVYSDPFESMVYIAGHAFTRRHYHNLNELKKKIVALYKWRIEETKRKVIGRYP